MQPFTSVTGIAVPFLEDDINTDKIAPIPTKRSLKPDYEDMFFHRARRHADDSLDAAHVLNQPHFARAAIFVTGRNFGCGSSREGAVWTMQAVGISCIIARSISDLYRENCLQNGVLPVELGEAAADDLERRVIAANGAAPFTVSGPGGTDVPFDMSAADRTRLLEGLDEIGMSLKNADAIAAWEARTRSTASWLQTAVRKPGTDVSR